MLYQFVGRYGTSRISVYGLYIGYSVLLTRYTINVPQIYENRSNAVAPVYHIYICENLLLYSYVVEMNRNI